MLVELSSPEVSPADEVCEVFLLRRHVIIRAHDDVDPGDMRIALSRRGQATAIDGAPIMCKAISVGARPLLCQELDVERYRVDPDVGIQVWVGGFLLQEHSLPGEFEPVIVAIDDVRDGHVVGWIAQTRDEALPTPCLVLDGAPLPRAKVGLEDNMLGAASTPDAIRRFRIRLPRRALDRMPHRLQMRVGDVMSNPFTWRASDPNAATPVAVPAYVFDREYYISLYSDITEVLTRNPEFDVAGHFWDCGLEEGRLPSVSFDIEFVQHKLRKVHGLSLRRQDVIPHFFSLPANERFVPNRWFSPATFRALYRDLVPADLGDYATFDYYDRNAATARLSPSGLFDEAGYRERYEDVDDLVLRGRFKSGFHHFMVAGWQADRRNLPAFGEGLFPAAARSREERDTLFHRHGEVRPIVWWFVETFYLEIYPDVRDQKRRGDVQSGLEHFLAHGCRERRVPHPLLLPLVTQVGGDAALFLREVAHRPIPSVDQGLSLDDAADLRAYLLADGRDRGEVDAILWPHVSQPWLSGSFDAERYLAANPDLARLFSHDRRRAVDHWRSHGILEGRPAPGSNLFANRVLSATDVLRGGKGVNVFGPLTLPTGLGEAARGYVDAMRQAGVAVDAHDVSGLLRPGAALEIFAPNRLRHSINLIFLNPDQVLPFAHRYGTQLFDHRINVGFWVWELPAARPEWRSTLACFDLIVTPSDFCTKAFAGETDARVVTVPYVVDRERLLGHAAAYQGNRWIDHLTAQQRLGRRIVLSIMDASSYTVRKGEDVFLATAARVEAAHPGRFLFVLKTHSRDRAAQRSYHADTHPSVTIIDEVFSWPDLCKLKQTADLFISPHRSEGFGLNIFESIVLGVPVVCSPFGGGPDALPEDFPFFIAGQLKEVGRHLGPYRPSAIWFEPDPASAAERILAFFDDEEAHRRTFAELQSRYARSFSAATVGGVLTALLRRHCGLGQDLEALAELFERSRAECFDFEMGAALSDGSQSISAMVQSCLTPKFSVITPTWNSDPAWLRELYQDLCGQRLQSWEWCIHDDGSTRPDTIATLTALRRGDARVKLQLATVNRGISAATNGAARISSGEYLLFVDHDDRISRDLLSVYAAAIGEDETPDILYCDEDKLFPGGVRRDHYLKPDWSPEHLLSTMYVLHCLGVRKSLFLRLGGYREEFSGAQDHDFLLRAASARARVTHVDQVLYHWRVSDSSAAMSSTTKPYAQDAGRRAVADHLRRLQVEGTVESGLLPGTYRVRPLVPDRPVALNILTSCACSREGGPTYVENLVRSILAHAYPVPIEIRVIVDVASLAIAKPLARLDRRVKVVRFDRGDRPFNFSEKANFAIRSAGTDRVVLMNDDMEALDGEWLGALLEVLELEDVGVVSGRLLHDDDTVQHSGIVLGVNGSASHVFVGASSDYVGYNAFTHVIRNYSAVTGALMAFRRSLLDEVGGFDPEFPIDFNDTDFCLRVLEAGKRIVFTPFARMRHFESRSALRLGADSYDEFRFCQRWRSYVDRDPYYNRNLRRDSSTYEANAYA